MPPKPLMCSAENLAADLTGKSYVVTGANSGIGLEVTQQLARQGASVTMACRNLPAATQMASDIAAKTGAPVSAMALDLGSLQSVRSFAAAFTDTGQRLDGLVNNAGVMNTPQGTTEDGFETQFGVNHLGPFLLTQLLLPLLKASAPSRIVHTSSVFHERGAIHLDDPNWQQRPYAGMQAYHDSKLAVVTSARQQGLALANSGVTSVSVHPGWGQTSLSKNTMPLWVQNYALYPVFRLMGMISPWHCAQTTLHCLLDPGVPDHNGGYFSQCSALYRDKAQRAGRWPMRSNNAAVYDDALAAQLHNASATLVGL